MSKRSSKRPHSGNVRPIAAPARLSHIRIATPTYDSVAPSYCRSLAMTFAMLVHNGIEVTIDMHVGSSLITSARNRLIANFMKSNDKVLFFLDADLGWDPIAFAKVLASPDDLAVACYPVKKPTEEYAVGMIADEAGRPVVRADGFVQVAHAATGFMKITRQWVERMIAAYPELRYKEQDGTECYALFDCQLIDGKYWGEDYVACKRWTAIGGEIWAWPNATFEHVGHRSWTGNLHEYLLKLGKEEAREAARTVSEAA